MACDTYLPTLAGEKYQCGEQHVAIHTAQSLQLRGRGSGYKQCWLLEEKMHLSTITQHQMQEAQLTEVILS